jgi:hypothetical protein
LLCFNIQQKKRKDRLWFEKKNMSSILHCMFSQKYYSYKVLCLLTMFILMFKQQWKSWTGTIT